MARLAVLFLLLAALQFAASQSIIGAHELCDEYGSGPRATEGCYTDFTSTAPSGYRVNMHSFA